MRFRYGHSFVFNGSEHKSTANEMVEQCNGGEASPTGSELLFTDDKLPVHMLHSLNMMRKNRTFCDVILHVGNSELHAHRAVLASVSPHLMEMFSVDDESKGNVRENVVIYHLNGGFNKMALEKLIDYAYTARLEVRSHEVKSVFMAATKLKMERVAIECAKYLVQHMDPENCIEMRSLPGIAFNKTFFAQVDSYIAQQFEEVSRSPMLLGLPCVRVEILNQTRQEMSLVCCDSLCQLVLDWVRRSHNAWDQTATASETMDTLSDKTHLLYLALDNTLQDCSELPSGNVSDTEIVQDYKKLSKKNTTATNKNRRKGQIQPANPRVLLYNRSDTLEPENDQDCSLIAAKKVGEHSYLALVKLGPRLVTLSVMLRLNQPTSPSPLPGTENGGSAQELDYAGAAPDLYCELANMVSVKCGAGCANLDNQLLVCGGYDRAECLRSVELYNPAQNVWTALAPMREARGRFNIAVVSKKVYAVGGSNGTTELDTVECYDPTLQKWTRVTSLSLARSNTGVCELGDKLYCIGGWNGQVGIRQCDVFDPETKQWTSIAPLQTGRYQAGVCALDGRVWAVGGCDGWNCLTSVEIYIPLTDTWTYAAPMITARRGCGVAVFKGKLYAVGGSDGTHSLNSTEVLDPETKTWSPGPSMSMPRSNVGVTVIAGRLYAVGGFSGKVFLNSIEYLDEKTDEWTTFSPSSNASCKDQTIKETSNGTLDSDNSTLINPLSRFSSDDTTTESQQSHSTQHSPAS